MFCQNSDHTLEGAEDRTVDEHRSSLLPTCTTAAAEMTTGVGSKAASLPTRVNIAQPEALREVEVELYGAALVLPARRGGQGIAHQLWKVVRTSA